MGYWVSQKATTWWDTVGLQASRPPSAFAMAKSEKRTAANPQSACTPRSGQPPTPAVVSGRRGRVQRSLKIATVDKPPHLPGSSPRHRPVTAGPRRSVCLCVQTAWKISVVVPPPPSMSVRIRVLYSVLVPCTQGSCAPPRLSPPSSHGQLPATVFPVPTFKVSVQTRPSVPVPRPWTNEASPEVQLGRKHLVAAQDSLLWPRPRAWPHLDPLPRSSNCSSQGSTVHAIQPSPSLPLDTFHPTSGPRHLPLPPPESLTRSLPRRAKTSITRTAVKPQFRSDGAETPNATPPTPSLLPSAHILFPVTSVDRRPSAPSLIFQFWTTGSIASCTNGPELDCAQTSHSNLLSPLLTRPRRDRGRPTQKAQPN